MIIRYLKRFPYAFAGIWSGIRTDFSFRMQFFGIMAAICIFILYVQPLTQSEYIFLGLAWVMILITELQNSAFEAALDRIHPEFHDEIGKSKDMAAGAVLIAGFFLVFVMAMIYWF